MVAASSISAAWLAAALLAAAPAHAADYVPVSGGLFTSVLSGGSANNDPVLVAPFALRSKVVTRAEFAAFMASHPQWQPANVAPVFADASYQREHDSKAPQPGSAPVTSVSWFAAAAYCEAEGARLPTWYEWELVAAADATRKDARKDPAWRARILDWYAQSSSKPPQASTGARNAYGVSDMHGLVWEWVEDFNALLVSADSRSQGDPDVLQYCGAGAISLQDRDNYAILMRVALLSSMDGAASTNSLGFRCARPATTEKQP